MTQLAEDLLSFPNTHIAPFVPFQLSFLNVRHEHSQRVVTINLAMAPP